MNIDIILYLASIADKLEAIFQWMLIMYVLALVCLAGYIISNDISNRGSIRLIKRTWLVHVLMIIIGLGALFIPPSSTIYMMLGVNATKQLKDSDMGIKVIKLLDKKLDQALENK